MDNKRTEGKHKADITTKHLYKYYLANIPKIDSLAGGKTRGSYDIKQKEYSNILKDINKGITDIIVLENFEFKIPYQLGIKSMKQKKLKYKLDENGELDTRFLSVDYKATKDLWKNDEEAKLKKTLIFHTNEHTDGNRMSYWWSKSGAKTLGIAAYYFVACRDVKRKPAKYLRNPDYKLKFFEKK